VAPVRAEDDNRPATRRPSGCLRRLSPRAGPRFRRRPAGRCWTSVRCQQTRNRRSSCPSSGLHGDPRMTASSADERLGRSAMQSPNRKTDNQSASRTRGRALPARRGPIVLRGGAGVASGRAVNQVLANRRRNRRASCLSSGSPAAKSCLWRRSARILIRGACGIIRGGQQPVVKVPAQHRGRRGAPLTRRDD